MAPTEERKDRMDFPENACNMQDCVLCEARRRDAKVGEVAQHLTHSEIRLFTFAHNCCVKMVTPKAPASTTAAGRDRDGGGPFPTWFRPGSPTRTKWLAFWLLVWDCTALLDALAFTFAPQQNLDGYLGEGTWCPATLAMVRMMANCQLGLVAALALVAVTGDERTLKIMFRMLIFVTQLPRRLPGSDGGDHPAAVGDPVGHPPLVAPHALPLLLCLFVLVR